MLNIHWLIYEMLLIKKVPENENTDKVIDIIEKILEFNKQQKEIGLKNKKLPYKYFKDYQQLFHRWKEVIHLKTQ